MKNVNAAPSVAITRCTDYDLHNVARAVTRQFELLGGVESFIKPGDSVLLKPNFIAPRPRRRAVQTDGEIILAVARLAKEIGAHPFVADSPAWSNVFACVKVLDLETPLKQLGVPVKQLNKPVRLPVGADGTRIGISSHALAADKIINLPKLKSHQQLVATFAVKNMFGCVPGKAKAFWHFARGGDEIRFCRLLIDIYKYLAPVITIIDAVKVMQGPGPIRGVPRNLGAIIGSTDPIACETICAGLTRIDPEKLPILRTAKQIGFGASTFEQISLLGDPAEDFVMNDFQIAKPTPIRFSLAHVCRSVCKQIWLLLKASAGKARQQD